MYKRCRLVAILAAFAIYTVSLQEVVSKAKVITHPSCTIILSFQIPTPLHFLLFIIFKELLISLDWKYIWI